jgi:hypothetical protein
MIRVGFKGQRDLWSVQGEGQLHSGELRVINSLWMLHLPEEYLENEDTPGDLTPLTVNIQNDTG